MERDIVYYPQDELNTFLLPVTRGCSYNRCAFCSMYKDIPYTEVPVSETELHLMNSYVYTERVFLTGADPMSIGFDKMKSLLEMIKWYLPYCACVSSYASVLNISKYSAEELDILHEKGLRLLYIGFESGSDEVLELMNKGHRRADAIIQAKKLNEAKLQFNTIIMYGIAGAGKGKQNAEHTAEMINRFVTNKIITMNLKIFGGTQLETMLRHKEFVPADQQELLEEIRTLVEKLDPEKPVLFDTTHPTNMIHMKGTLPQDRSRLIHQIQEMQK